MNAFICNFKEHWFTIRKIAHSWFNLNSMNSGPEIVSNTYLALFLKTLQHEGLYGSFVAFTLLILFVGKTMLTSNKCLCSILSMLYICIWTFTLAPFKYFTKA